MSDREMRLILESVIDDIDSGKLRVIRQHPRFLKKLGAPALAAMIALSAGACMEYAAPEYGVPPVDAAVDASMDADISEVDADPSVDYMAPFLPPDHDPAPDPDPDPDDGK